MAKRFNNLTAAVLAQMKNMRLCEFDFTTL
jgi:hypothetical protein